MCHRQFVTNIASLAELLHIRQLCHEKYNRAAFLGWAFELALNFDGGAAVCRITRDRSKLTTVDKDSE